MGHRGVFDRSAGFNVALYDVIRQSRGEGEKALLSEPDNFSASQTSRVICPSFKDARGSLHSGRQGGRRTKGGLVSPVTCSYRKPANAIASRLRWNISGLNGPLECRLSASLSPSVRLPSATRISTFVLSVFARRLITTIPPFRRGVFLPVAERRRSRFAFALFRRLSPAMWLASNLPFHTWPFNNPLRTLLLVPPGPRLSSVHYATGNCGTTISIALGPHYAPRRLPPRARLKTYRNY